MRNFLTIMAIMIAMLLIMSPYIPDTRYTQIIKARAAESADSGASTSEQEPPEESLSYDERTGQWIGIAILFILCVVYTLKLIFGGSI